MAMTTVGKIRQVLAHLPDDHPLRFEYIGKTEGAGHVLVHIAHPDVGTLEERKKARTNG